ncbi:MAG: alpha/beta fold hydrolase [Gemmatimonadaceae bacterium]|nr:alpha/beta fold hydrolase [Gemmatimonadaceae bacterium]
MIAARRIFHVIVLGALTVSSACSLDAFLFNERHLDSYNLSSRVIPDSLRMEGEWRVGDDRVAYAMARRPGTTPRFTMLFCHGNKESMEQYWDRVEAFWRTGFDVLTFDYRGFGRSTGTSSEATMRADGEAALAFLRARGVADSSLAINGFSLGGVCAIHLAAHVVTPRALIVESAFTNSEGLVRSGTILAVPGEWLMRDRYDNLAAIPLVSAPTLLLHGDADTFLPYAFSESLFAASRATIKRLIRIHGGNHTDIPLVLGPDEYAQLIHRFVLAPSSSGATVLPLPAP